MLFRATDPIISQIADVDKHVSNWQASRHFWSWDSGTRGLNQLHCCVGDHLHCPDQEMEVGIFGIVTNSVTLGVLANAHQALMRTCNIEPCRAGDLGQRKLPWLTVSVGSMEVTDCNCVWLISQNLDRSPLR